MEHRDLAPLLLEPSAGFIGAHEVVPVLVEVTAGTGKTWSSIQLAHQLAVQSATEGEAVKLVPVCNACDPYLRGFCLFTHIMHVLAKLAGAHVCPAHARMLKNDKADGQSQQ